LKDCQSGSTRNRSGALSVRLCDPGAIFFPAFSIGLASYLAVLEAQWLRTGDDVYLSVFNFRLKIFAVVSGMGGQLQSVISPPPRPRGAGRPPDDRNRRLRSRCSAEQKKVIARLALATGFLISRKTSST
jgi:hypothetical protein